MEINGTTYNDRTPPAVAAILDRARLSRYTSRPQRLRLFLGDADTGRDWLEECDTTGYIGRSTGTVKIPLLVHNDRSHGGPALLDHCLVKIVDTRTRAVLWQHPLYNMPDLTIEQRADGLTAVLADGQEHANFATPDAARRFVAYMRGERFNK